MKLGIVVVYMVREENARLLDLHLEYIHRWTSVPYTIYAGVHRLEPRFRAVLENDVNVHVCDIAPTELTGAEEHSYYLQALTEEAIRNGSTHVATFHPDSFPIRAQWAEELIASLDDEHPLVGILEAECGDTMARPCPAGMVFTAEFYQRLRPRFWIPETEQKSKEFQDFLARHKQKPIHSGIGFGYALHRAGLSWCALRRSNAHNDHHTMAGVYGGVIFHLAAAVRGKYFFQDYPSNLSSGLDRFFHRLRMRAERFVPECVWDFCGSVLPVAILNVYDRRRASERIFRSISKRLYEDDERYIASLIE